MLTAAKDALYLGMGQMELSIFAMLLAMCIALGFWFRVPAPRTPLFHALGVLIAGGIAVEAIGFLLNLHGNSTATMYNVYVLLECFIVLRMVALVHAPWRWFALGGAGVATLAMGLALVANGGNFSLLIERGVVSIALILTVSCLGVLWQLAQTSTVALHRVPAFWIFMGLLVYFGGMSPLITMVNHLYRTDPQLAKQLYLIMPLLCIIRYGLIALACKLERDRYVEEYDR